MALDLTYQIINESNKEWPLTTPITPTRRATRNGLDLNYQASQEGELLGVTLDLTNNTDKAGNKEWPLTSPMTPTRRATRNAPR